MQRRTLWFAFAFAAVPTLIFACGGRSDIDLLLADDSPDGGVKAGAAGSAGKAGSGQSGAAGKGAGAGQAGAGNAAGQKTTPCVPGQQVECACPGTDASGIQVCSKDGQGLSACTGCPPPDNTAGSSGAGQAGTAGKGGGAGKGGSGSGGKTGQGGSPPEGGGGAGSPQAGQTGAAGKPQDPPDAGDFFDSLPFPLPDSGPVGTCVNCLQSQCGDAINSCYNDPSCTQGIQCAISTCFAGGMGGNPIGGGNPMGGNPLGGGLGGGVNFGCLLGCFNGDVTAVFAAIQTFQCITQTCGSDCGGGLLGDGGGFPLGGLGGGGAFGGLGGGQPGGSQSPEAQMISGVRYIDGVRVPLPSEVPGYPLLQEALTPRSR